MNLAQVNRIAEAVLYEGYILYPYRPSVKNRQRWTFGGVYPEDFCRGQVGSDSSRMQTECLLAGDAQAVVAMTIRFLHLTERTVGALAEPLDRWPRDYEPSYRPAEVLRIEDQVYYPWQEAQEREISLAGISVGELANEPAQEKFSFSGRRLLEPLFQQDGQIAGVLIREQQSIEGVIERSAEPLAEGLWKLRLRIDNQTPLEESSRADRDAALARSLLSTHAILSVRDGDFVSLFDPPEAWRRAVASCQNLGTWPVLVGEEGQKDTLLSSPIILYDYPQIAPESPGNLFDGTEIDEILSLRIMTLTDEEKQAAAGTDTRVRELLKRTEALARDELLGLHGTLRQPGSASREKP